MSRSPSGSGPDRAGLSVTILLLGALLGASTGAQVQTWTFVQDDLGPFQELLADLAETGRIWPKLGDDYLGHAVSWPQEPPARRGEPRDSWNAGITILKYPDEKTAIAQWRRGNIGTNFINFRRDEIEAQRASLDRHGLGGRIEVEDDRIVAWSVRYHPRVFSGRGPAPPRQDGRNYWIKMQLQIVSRHRNCIISALAGRVMRIQGQAPIGSTLLRADPWQLEAAARRLVDAKWGEAEPEPEAEEEPRVDPEAERLWLEQRWYDGLLDAMAKARREAALARMTLSVQRMAAGKIRHRIGQLRLILRDENDDDGIFDVSEELVEWWYETREDLASRGATGAVKEAVAKRIEELEGDLAEIDREQRAGLERQSALLDDIEHELNTKGADCRDADLKEGISAQREALELMRELGLLELRLAAGQRAEFRTEAERLLRANKHTADVRFMQGLEQLERGQPRAGLQAFRLTLAANPDHPMAREQIRILESGYLEQIDRKVLGEAAALRKLCDDRLAAGGEAGYWSALKSFLTVGVVSATSAYSGREEALGELASIYGDDAAASHAGLMIMKRLRGRGVDLDYMAAMNNTEFIAAVDDHFGWKLEPQDARRMRASMKAAFRNTDVQRLLENSREQLAVDTGAAYGDTSDFDDHWLQSAGDGINIKNVLLMLGPMSAVSAGGKTAKVAYWGRWMGSPSAPTDVVTLKDAFAGFIRLQELADRLAAGKTGKACADAILRWHDSTGLVSHVLADALIQQGAIGAAGKIGELTGHGPELALLAEFFTAYGIGDIDVSVKLLKQGGLDDAAMRKLVQGFSSAADGLEAGGLPPGKLKQVRETLATLAEGKRPSSGQLPGLKKSLAEIDGRLAALRARFKTGGASAGSLHEHQSLVALKRATKQAEAGQLKAAGDSLTLAEEMDALRGGMNRTLDTGKSAVKKVESSLRQAGRQAPPPGAGARGNPRLEGGLRWEGAEPSDLRQVVFDGRAHRKGLDQLLLENEPDRAARGYRKLLGFAESIDQGGRLRPLRDDLARRLEFAERVAEARKRLDVASLAENASGSSKVGAAESFTTGELKRLEADKALDFVEIPGTKDAPFHLIKRGPKGKIVERWVFKETSRKTAESAQVMGRIGKDLGVDVPAGAFVTLQRNGQPVTGTLYRYVDGQSLIDCDVFTQFAVKKDIAVARVFRSLGGDFDLQGKNVLIGRGGRRWQIDFDEADLMGDRLSIFRGDSLRDRAEKHLDHVLDLVDGPAGQQRPIYQVVRGIENQATGEEIKSTLERIRSTWTREYMKKNFLEGVETMNKDAVLDILEARRDVIEKVLEKRFKRIGDHIIGRASPPIRTGWETRFMPPSRAA